MGKTYCCSSFSPSQQDYQDVINKIVAVEEMSYIDELISYIEQILNAIQEGRVNSIALLAKTNRVGSSINSSGGLLEKVLKRSERHICKRDIMPKLNHETRKLVMDIANQGAHIQWVGIALSVVGFVLERIEQISSNREEFIQLFIYMSNLAKYIKQLNDHLDLAQEKLNRVLQFIVQGSLVCVSQMGSHALSKFFTAPVAAEDIGRLQAELGHEYQKLSLEAIIAVLNRIPVVLPPSQGRTPQELVLKKPEIVWLTFLKVVVIYGQDGIGKTTLVRTVFSKLDLKNYKYCRIDIKQNCSKAGLELLQQQILRPLYCNI
ncbi:uncharacterized protein LOC131047408 [Cryptomeria japonica]|uniref:uncharacterized protein LOC131047408 n=1 Tax=Cryptomeria japonica TaxID=3369 RepID=UPI0027DA5D72|nr:uncharacterized protein LOC131047408 [Cryptomeria japonica]XP_057837278.2 uncharacterized protein LOC131047408 [Cryptomeria japonica]